MNSSPFSQDTFKSSSVLGGMPVRFTPPSLLSEDLTSYGSVIQEEESLFNSSSFKEKNQLPPVVNMNLVPKSAEKVSEGICTWRTTGEFICPLQQSSPHRNNNIKILLFQQITIAQQRDLITKLFQLWHVSYRAMGITNMQMLELFIKETFVQGNALFVAISSGGTVLGCTAIDFLRSVPFISQQMSVHNDREVLKMLEDHAVLYGSKFHYPKVQVWCNKENIAAYEQRGWKYLMETQTKSGWKVVMERKYF
jgi:hypothetical protein